MLGGCYQVPVTGRQSMNLVDDKEVTKMSVAAFDDMKRQYPLSRDKERIAQLQRVGDRISKVVFWDMPDADWEFVVFEVPQQINAFAMAGGKVGDSKRGVCKLFQILICISRFLQPFSMFGLVMSLGFIRRFFAKDEVLLLLICKLAVCLA